MITKKLTHFTLVVIACVIGFAAFYSPLAKAAYTDYCSDTIQILGRYLCRGYFQGTNYYYATGTGIWIDDVLEGGMPGWVDTPSEFINFYQGQLWGGGIRATGAAFVILSMLGVNGPATGGRGPGIALAQARFGEWANRVNAYASTPGYGINFYQWLSLGPSTINSGRAQGSFNSGEFNDMVYYRQNSWKNEFFVVFTNPNGTAAIIQRNCSNMIGTTNFTLSSATLSARSGSDGTINTTNSSQNFTFRLWVDVSNAVGVGGDNFNWQIQRNYNNNGWTNSGVPAPDNGSAGIVGNGRRYGFRDITQTYNAPGTYCFRITLTGKPGYAVYSPQTSPAQCVTVIKNAEYRATSTATDYEKGGPPAVVTYRLFATPPCGPGMPDQNVTWGGDYIPNRSKTNEADTSFPYVCTEIEIDTATLQVPSTAVPASVVDNALPGPYGSFRSRIFSPISFTSPPASVTIFEAPFARFLGNDARICGPGGQNRFVYDNRTPANTGSLRRGSYAEMASIYTTGNASASSFSGLNSSAVNAGFPTALASNWNTCTPARPSEVGTPTAATTVGGITLGAPNDKRTYYAATGDITITGPIIVNTPGGAFDPNTHPVVLIYAPNGSIRINPGVTRIDAVLVANTIDTCAGVNKIDLEVGCRTPLTINGAISANTTLLKRAIGTRYLADNGTPNGVPAETINFPWYLHFVTLQLPDTSATKFDAYYSTAPRL